MRNVTLRVSLPTFLVLFISTGCSQPVQFLTLSSSIGRIQGKLSVSPPAVASTDPSALPSAAPTAAGWTVYIDQNGNGKLDPGEPSTTTDSSGAFTFSNLLTGTYTVSVAAPNGSVPISPTQSYQVSVTSGQDSTVQPFVFAPSALPVLSPPSCTAAVGSGPSYTVDVGYADGLRGDPYFPSPWYGSPNVVFIGINSGDIDGGAIKINNLSGALMHVDDATVTLPTGAQFDLWGANDIPAGSSLILTETVQYNFDTSDFPTLTFPQVYADGETAHAALIDLIINGVKQPTLLDTGHVLTTGGSDLAAGGTNEAVNWRAIATTGVQNRGGFKLNVFAQAMASEFPKGSKVQISGYAMSRQTDCTAATIASVTINGNPVDSLDASGLFTASVTVVEGPNSFVIVATDSGGVTGTVNLNLTGF